MDRSAWCYISGVVSAREGQLFPSDFFRSLVSQDRLEGVFLAVSDTALKDMFPRASTLSEADSIVRSLAHEEYAELRRYSPDPTVVDLILFRDEFYNVKGYLKAKLAGVEFAPLPNGRVTAKQVERLWDALATPHDAAFAKPVATVRRLTDGETDDRSSLIDWVLDGAYFQWALRQARRLKAPSITRYVELSSCLRTIAMICRAHAAGVDMARFASTVLT